MKTAKRIDEGKEELISSEQLKEILDKRERKGRHFPYNVFYKLKRVYVCGKGWVINKWSYVYASVFKKYNVVKIKTLPPTYTDTDRKLLHVSFTLLCDIIEKEKLLDSLKNNAEHYLDARVQLSKGKEFQSYRVEDIDFVDQSYKEYYSAWVDLTRLYNWWKNKRPLKIKEIDLLWEKGKAEEPLGKEVELYEEETNNLISLMKHRKYLWT